MDFLGPRAGRTAWVAFSASFFASSASSVATLATVEVSRLDLFEAAGVAAFAPGRDVALGREGVVVRRDEAATGRELVAVRDVILGFVVVVIAERAPGVGLVVDVAAGRGRRTAEVELSKVPLRAVLAAAGFVSAGLPAEAIDVLFDAVVVVAGRLISAFFESSTELVDGRDRCIGVVVVVDFFVAVVGRGRVGGLLKLPPGEGFEADAVVDLAAVDEAAAVGRVEVRGRRGGAAAFEAAGSAGTDRPEFSIAASRYQ